MNIYIAGKYTAKDRLAKEREVLREMGFEVTSSWMDEVYTSDHDARVDDEVREANALRDLSEVKDADVFIIDTFDDSNTGGREVELGIAIGDIKIAVYRVGPYRNVFHTLCDATFETWDAMHDYLESTFDAVLRV